MRKFLVFLILAVILWLSSLSFASNSRAADSDDYVSNILSQRPEKDPWSPIPDANNTGVFWEIFNTPSYIGEYRAIRVRVTPIAPDSALRDLPNGKKLRSASILYLVNCQNIAFAKKSVGSFSKPFT